jgi:alpha-L-rhamnosidase
MNKTQRISLLAVLLLPALAASPLVDMVDAADVWPESQISEFDAHDGVSITDLRTEGVSQPMGIEEAAPRFSWRYKATAEAPRGFHQAYYQIQVASSAEKLAKGEADLWDSGKQAGSDTLEILYAGKPLQSATRYFWQVRGFDGEGKVFVSQPQYFETGLLKAGDWQAAQWISAHAKRPKTIPTNLQGMTDYTLQTRFRIQEGSAVVMFRTTYAWGKGYGIEIQPGTPGKLLFTSNPEQKKPEVLKEITIGNIGIGEWHSLQVDVKGDTFAVRIDNTPVGTEPFRDAAFKSGTVALGAVSPIAKTKGLVQFKDFRLDVNGEMLIQEDFADPGLFAFQECFRSNDTYAVVKDGALEVRNMKTFLDPKKNLEAPLFRKTFSTESKKIVRARAYVAGLGYYTFWLNGKRLDDYLLQPGYARYNKTAYYTVYDLTDHLAADNALAFELGRGWYGMTTPTLWGETFTQDWMAEPALRVLVTIDYADGSRQTIASDPSFKTAPGPTMTDSVKSGESYDARKELPGWNTIGFDDKKWSPSVLAQGKMPSAAPGLTAQLFEPIRIVESIAPVTITKIEDEKDAWIVDFGRNMAGGVELKVKAAPGQRFRMSYLETAGARIGREKWDNFGDQATGSFQTDSYIAKGGAEETFMPHYSYKGFRYLRIEGFKEQPSPDQITAKVFNSDMTGVGKFSSSSELWNKIWMAGRRSIQSNMHSIPTDCPTWEKLGWTCDDASPYYGMAYNFDLRKLYEKRLQDYADDITPDGLISNTIPSAWAKGGDPSWVGSYVNIAWKYYQTYGDRRVIKRHYDNLKRYMGTLIKEGEASEKPPLLTKPRGSLGDWVSPDGNVPPEGALIYYNLQFYRYACMMADMAKVIGRPEDEKYYSTLAADLKKRFNEFHFEEKEGCYYSSNRGAGFRQSPQAMALAYGLVPENLKPVVTAHLAEDIQKKRNGHFWVGILGMEAIADALSENGRDDVAYAGHLKDDYPSLGNIIREGATTLWEDLTIKKARSLNHKMFASPLGWLARYVAGLRVDGILDGGAGFRKAMIDPHPVPSAVTFAELDYDSPMGRYHSGWKVTPEGMTYEITIPPNATATFRLPLLGQKKATISESSRVLWNNGKPADSIPGISSPVEAKDHLVMTLGSGTYSFLVKGQAAPAKN